MNNNSELYIIRSGFVLGHSEDKDDAFVLPLKQAMVMINETCYKSLRTAFFRQCGCSTYRINRKG